MLMEGLLDMAQESGLWGLFRAYGQANRDSAWCRCMAGKKRCEISLFI